MKLLTAKFSKVNNKLLSAVFWLAKWCKIHKVYIHSHSVLLLLFMNIFIHIQQPNLQSRNILINIYRCISNSPLYLLTFTRCLHSHSRCYIHSHTRIELLILNLFITCIAIYVKEVD